MVTLNQLVQFIALAEHGSLHPAAESLHISDPALSIGLGKLEAGLGCRLFERSSSGFELTEFGEVALRRARAALAEIDLMQKEIKSLKEDVRPIRLAGDWKGFCSLAGDFLAGRYPDRDFEAVVVRGIKRLEGMVTAGSCDLALPTASAYKGFVAEHGAVKLFDIEASDGPGSHPGGAVYLIACSDDEEVAEMARLLQEECGRQGGMDIAPARAGRPPRAPNLEVLDG